MSSRVVGKVAITPKGTWNALSSYEKLDAVVQNNVMYIAKINVPVGTAVTDTAYWWRSIGLSSDSTDLYLFDDEELETLADEDFIPFFSTENSSGRKISWESIKKRISAFIHGIPSGGTTGQVLKKTSGVDFDVEWGDGGGSGTAGLTEISSADYDDLPDEDKQNPDIAYFLPDGVGSDVVDDELDSTSHNPVENMAIANALGNKMDKANPTGTGSFSLNRKADTTVGNYSFTEGYNTTASGNYSHAEGDSTSAEASSAHAEGRFTVARSAFQHVQGKFNEADNNGKYVDIVGWGTNGSSRRNIETTDTSGVKWARSDVRCGGSNQDDASAISLTQLNSDLSNLQISVSRGVSYCQGTGTISGNTATFAINNCTKIRGLFLVLIKINGNEYYWKLYGSSWSTHEIQAWSQNSISGATQSISGSFEDHTFTLTFTSPNTITSTQYFVWAIGE